MRKNETHQKSINDWEKKAFHYDSFSKSNTAPLYYDITDVSLFNNYSHTDFCSNSIIFETNKSRWFQDPDLISKNFIQDSKCDMMMPRVCSPIITKAPPLDSTKRIEEALKVNEFEARTIRERLLHQIDEISKNNKSERFSSADKERLIIAILKTAESLSKNLAEIKE
jgi:hypothetical protein